MMVENNVIVTKVLYPEEVRKTIARYAQKDQPREISPKARGAIIHAGLARHIAFVLGYFDKLTDDQKENVDNVRRLVLAWITLSPDDVFVPVSSSDLTAQELTGVSRWISEYKDGVYQLRPSFREELRIIVWRAQEDLRRTVAAMKRGEDIVFGDLLQRWLRESPISDDYGKETSFEHWSADDFQKNFVTDENIERFRAEEKQRQAQKPVVEDVPDVVTDPLAEFFG